MDYRELNDEDYSKLRRGLIKTKGSPEQKEFLDVLKDSKRFVKWIEGKIKIEKNGRDFDLVSDKLTENEFKEPPVQTEEELFKKWKKITPAQACRSTFWGYITLRHIKEDKIESFFLAANGGNLPGGLERIDEALASGKDEKVDSIVRTALRRLSGLPEARGNKTVYVDCPFGRSWWRCHIAREVCEKTGADKEKVMEVLRVTQAYWEELINSVVSKNSVFGDEKIRAALIWVLSEKFAGEKTTLFTGDGVRKIIKKIGVRLAWQELSVFSTNELKILFEKEFLT